jgi:hypothetical protein
MLLLWILPLEELLMQHFKDPSIQLWLDELGALAMAAFGLITLREPMAGSDMIM